jgi:hypothetical protein
MQLTRENTKKRMESNLQGIVDYFCPELSNYPTGVRGTPSTVLSQSRMPESPIIFTDTANLCNSLVLPKLPTVSCTPDYIVHECGCKRHIIPSTCMSLACTSCAPFIGKRRAQSIRLRFERYQRGTGRLYYVRPVLYTVFTVPMEIRHKFLDALYLREVRQKIWTILKNKYGALFGVEATHPIGESDEVFHPHLNFLWMQQVGVSAYLDVHSLRQDWADVLGVSVVDVYHQYSTKSWLVNHWCKYVSRVFPGYHNWTGPIRWYGKYPKRLPKPEILCAECGQPWRIIGRISASLVSDYYQRGWLLGLDPPWYNNSKLTLWKGKHGKRNRPNETINRSDVCV